MGDTGNTEPERKTTEADVNRGADDIIAALLPPPNLIGPWPTGTGPRQESRKAVTR